MFFAPHRNPARIATATVIAFAALTAAGCATHEVTVERNGTVVTRVPAPDTDVEACSAMTDTTLEHLGLSAADATELVDPSGPGCTWTSRRAASGQDADLTLWTLASGTSSEPEGSRTIDGVEVGIWGLYEDSGRFIVPCGDLELSINYIQKHGPAAPEDALTQAASDAIAAYACE